MSGFIRDATAHIPSGDVDMLVRAARIGFYLQIMLATAIVHHTGESAVVSGLKFMMRELVSCFSACTLDDEVRLKYCTANYCGYLLEARSSTSG